MIFAFDSHHFCLLFSPYIFESRIEIGYNPTTFVQIIAKLMAHPVVQRISMITQNRRPRVGKP
jgi:hypothetical protein